jgi:hypothetical protein
MGRPMYVCIVCSEHFTRKFSARRHNSNIHNGVYTMYLFLVRYFVLSPNDVAFADIL